jgi:hypothetical protein
MGRNASWDLLEKLTPAIPFLDRVVAQIESSFGLIRSSKHSYPNRETEVMGLINMFTSNRIFERIAGREHHAGDKYPKDAFTVGQMALADNEYLQKLFKERWSFIKHRSSFEDYSIPECVEEKDEVEFNIDRANEEEDYLPIDHDWASTL